MNPTMWRKALTTGSDQNSTFGEHDEFPLTTFQHFHQLRNPQAKDKPLKPTPNPNPESESLHAVGRDPAYVQVVDRDPVGRDSLIRHFCILSFGFTFYILIFDFPLRDTLHASRNTNYYVRIYKKNTQNESNLRKSQMNVNNVSTKDYDKRTLGQLGKTNPIQTQYKPNACPPSVWRVKGKKRRYHIRTPRLSREMIF